MLEHIFGSNTRVRILNILYKNPKKVFYVRQLSREIGMQLNSVRRELENLKSVGIIIEVENESLRKSKNKEDEKPEKKDKFSYIEKLKKFYALNPNFLLFHELRSLILKSRLFMEKNLVQKIEGIARINLLILTGAFVGMENTASDMLLVGVVDRKKLVRVIEEFEKELSHKINYAVMSYREYKYRKEITDKFLYDILENKNIIVVDNIQEGV